LFTLANIRDRFSDIMTRWFQIYGRFRVPLEILHAAAHGDSQWIADHFLAAAQSAEVLHRVSPRYSNEVIRSSDFARLQPKLQATLREFSDSNVLAGRLEHLNEPTLRTRIKELSVDCGPNLRSMLKTLDPFPKRVASWRNELTHPKKHRRQFDWPMIDRLAESLILVLYTQLLLELGYDAIEADALVTNLGRYKVLDRHAPLR
jgi:hypothetical protein